MFSIMDNNITEKLIVAPKKLNSDLRSNLKKPPAVGFTIANLDTSNRKAFSLIMALESLIAFELPMNSSKSSCFRLDSHPVTLSTRYVMITVVRNFKRSDDHKSAKEEASTTMSVESTSLAVDSMNNSDTQTNGRL